MTQDKGAGVDLERLNRLREEAALERFEPRPLDQPWPAQAAFAKAMYDGGPAILDRLQAAEAEGDALGESMRMYARYSTIHLQQAEDAEAERDEIATALADWLGANTEMRERAERAEAETLTLRAKLGEAVGALEKLSEPSQMMPAGGCSEAYYQGLYDGRVEIAAFARTVLAALNPETED